MNASNSRFPMTSRAALSTLAIAFAVFILLPLGFHGLWIPDETRYAQIGQEMLHSGDWISPHFMGLRYFEKPIGGYWFFALGQAVFGENLFGARIASALASGLSVLIAYVLARAIWGDQRKAFWAALLYMSFGLVMGQALYANLDPQFTFWVNLSFAGLWFAASGTTSRQRWAGWIVLGLATSMAFLTKGFLAWALPFIVGVPYFLWQRRWRELLGGGSVAAILAITTSLPWAILVQLRNPDYWNFFFWNEHIRRFAAQDAQHTQPLWFFVPLLLVGCLPWAMNVAGALADGWRDRRKPAMAFLLLWFALPFALFSIARGKLFPYILPCLLPLALLTANSLERVFAQAGTRSIRVNAALNGLLGLAIMVAPFWLSAHQGIFTGEPIKIAVIAGVGLFWVAVAAAQWVRPLRYRTLPALCMGLALALIPAFLPTDAVINSKTPDQFIASHLSDIPKDATLLSNELGTASALAWRLDRSDVYFYDERGELAYGLDYPDAHERLIALDNIRPWIADKRRQGPVVVAMRINQESDLGKLDLLPPGGREWRAGKLVLRIYDRAGS